MDANQFVYWLKGITDTSAVPTPDQWAKIARKIEEVIAASSPKLTPPPYPVMRNGGDLDEAKRQMKEAHNRLVKGQYEEAARQTNVEAYRDYPPKFAPESPAPITYPTVIAGVQMND